MSSAEKKLAHMVYFTLKDKSPVGIERQLAACRKYLTGHEGVEFLGVGTRTPDLARPVNDSTFDIGVHVIFKSRAAHDAYQVHPRHVQFLEESKPHWEQVRVFDADV
jgi:hypothetical protein